MDLGLVGADTLLHFGYTLNTRGIHMLAQTTRQPWIMTYDL
jgi:hypothetical protein